MKSIKSIKSMQRMSLRFRSEGRKIAFVPTMGALHEGHMSLIRKARKVGDILVVSIFVNPAQFGAGEDLSRYPRSLDADRRLLRACGTDILFLPNDKSMYPHGLRTYVEGGKIGSILEGEFRSTHFRGVTTIVSKLFNIVRPDVAIFGQKDAQQSFVIRQMVQDLDIPVRIRVERAVRERSGLAMSSRNRYFNEEQLCRAACIYRGLKAGRDLARSCKTTPGRVISSVKKEISKIPGTDIEYIAIRSAESFGRVTRIEENFLILAAVRLDGVRLIDNIEVRIDRR